MSHGCTIFLCFVFFPVYYFFTCLTCCTFVSPCMKINWLVFFFCFFVFFSTDLRSDKRSFFPLEKTTRVLGANYYFSEKIAKLYLSA